MHALVESVVATPRTDAAMDAGEPPAPKAQQPTREVAVAPGSVPAGAAHKLSAQAHAARDVAAAEPSATHKQPSIGSRRSTPPVPARRGAPKSGSIVFGVLDYSDAEDCAVLRHERAARLSTSEDGPREESIVAAAGRASPQPQQPLRLASTEEEMRLWQGAEDQLSDGNAHAHAQAYAKAVTAYKRALELSSTMQDAQLRQLVQLSALSNMGHAYRALHAHKYALQCHTRALALARALAHPRTECAELGCVGNSFFDLGEFARAAEHYSHSLAAARKLGDHTLECVSLCNLGSAHLAESDARSAVKYYSHALAAGLVLADQRFERWVLVGLGTAHAMLGRYDDALKHHTRALSLARARPRRAAHSAAAAHDGRPAVSAVSRQHVRLTLPEHRSKAPTSIRERLARYDQLWESLGHGERLSEFADAHHGHGAGLGGKGGTDAQRERARSPPHVRTLSWHAQHVLGRLPAGAQQPGRRSGPPRTAWDVSADRHGPHAHARVRDDAATTAVASTAEDGGSRRV